MKYKVVKEEGVFYVKKRIRFLFWDIWCYKTYWHKMSEFECLMIVGFKKEKEALNYIERVKNEHK